MGGVSRDLWTLRLACLALAAATIAILSPGRLGPDETDMLRQAQGGIFHDWHAPLLAWVWGLGLKAWPGPGFMQALQTALTFLGIYLCGSAMAIRGHRIAAWVIVALSLFPLTWIALGAAGSKDAIVTALLACACGTLGRVAPGRRLAAVGVVAFALAATAIRQNAVFGAVPILGTLAWLTIRSRPLPRLMISASIGALGSLALLLGSGAATRAALSVQPSNLVAALYIFDLSGISHHAGKDAADGLLGEGFQASAAECYHPAWWDPYAVWGPCPGAWRALFGRELPMPTRAEEWAPYFSRAMLEKPTDIARKRELRARWAAAIVENPVAYLRHRLAHMREALGLGDDIGGMDWVDMPSMRRPAVTAINDVANRLAALPFLMPWAWMLLAALCAIASLRLPAAAAVLPFALSASALCYGLGYLLVGVAWSYRYFHWTIVAAAIGAICLASAFARQPAASLTSTGLAR